MTTLNTRTFYPKAKRRALKRTLATSPLGKQLQRFLKGQEYSDKQQAYIDFFIRTGKYDKLLAYLEKSKKKNEAQDHACKQATMAFEDRVTQAPAPYAQNCSKCSATMEITLTNSLSKHGECSGTVTFTCRQCA